MRIAFFVRVLMMDSVSGYPGNGSAFQRIVPQIAIHILARCRFVSAVVSKR